MHPTELGQEVIHSARFVLAQLAQMAEGVESMRAGRRGSLTIAYRTLSVQPLLAQAVCAFHEANPLVSVNVTEGAIGDLIEQLTQGQLDLLFAYQDPRFERSELLLAVLPARIAAQMVGAGVARTLRFNLASRVEPVVIVRNAVLEPRRSAAAFLELIMRRAADTGLLTAPAHAG